MTRREAVIAALALPLMMSDLRPVLVVECVQANLSDQMIARLQSFNDALFPAHCVVLQVAGRS